MKQHAKFPALLSSLVLKNSDFTYFIVRDICHDLMNHMATTNLILSSEKLLKADHAILKQTANNSITSIRFCQLIIHALQDEDSCTAGEFQRFVQRFAKCKMKYEGGAVAILDRDWLVLACLVALVLFPEAVKSVSSDNHINISSTRKNNQWMMTVKTNLHPLVHQKVTQISYGKVSNLHNANYCLLLKLFLRKLAGSLESNQEKQKIVLTWSASSKVQFPNSFLC